MSNLFHFKPKASLDAEHNLIQFINECKNELTVFGEDLKWSNWRWSKAAVFSKLGTNSRTTNEVDKLDDEFIDFGKAYFRYQQGHNPTGTKNELKALRASELALLQVNKSAKVDGFSITVLDEASKILRQHYSATAAYQGGRELERLAKFVSDKQLISKDLRNWKNPNSRAADTVKTGSKAKKRRERKLPSEEALSAMAEIFANNPQNPKDIFTSSVFAMTMCAPVRITEILIMPFDCEVYETDSKGVERYGWRFHSGKGFGYNIKWIPTEMISVAKEAISRIKKLTDPARELAKHVEEHPDKFYRHSDCPDVKDNALLSLKQTAEALEGEKFSDKDIRNTHFNSKLAYRNRVHSLNTLWKYVMSRQPELFPYIHKEVKIKYSDALFCMNKNQLHDIRVTSPVVLWLPTNNVFNNDISPRESVKSNHQSIFDRLGYKNKDGERL